MLEPIVEYMEEPPRPDTMSMFSPHIVPITDALDIDVKSMRALVLDRMVPKSACTQAIKANDGISMIICKNLIE